jgi:hypothetical protein
MFPPELIRGQMGIGFTFARRDRLFDFYSISSWCQTTAHPRLDPRTVELCVHYQDANCLKRCLSYIEEISTEDQQSGEWRCEFGNDRRELNFMVSISIDGPSFLKLLFGTEQTKKLPSAERSYWETAKSMISCLARLNVKFDGEDVDFVLENADPMEGFLSTRESHGVGIRVNKQKEIRTAIAEALRFVKYLSETYKLAEGSVRAQILDKNIVDLFERFRHEVTTTECYFTYVGEYHKDFHPDQVLGTVPQEGYWLFPMFTFQAAGADSDVMVYLVQTENDRFFEFEIEENDFQKFLKRSKFDIPYETYTGPREQRWGLDKLLRSAPTFIKPAKKATTKSPSTVIDSAKPKRKTKSSNTKSTKTSKKSSSTKKSPNPKKQ